MIAKGADYLSFISDDYKTNYQNTFRKWIIIYRFWNIYQISTKQS